MTLEANSSAGRIAVTTLLLIIPFVTWAVYAGEAFVHYLSHPPLPGQLSYLLARLLGMVAATVLVAQIILVLIRHLPALPSRLRVSIQLHRTFGFLIAIATLSHIVFFMGAVAARTGEIPWYYLTPVINTDYYRTSITLGWISLVLFTIVIPSGLFILHSKNNHRTGVRSIHRCALPAGAVALLHSYLIGTESWLLLSLLAIFSILLVGAVLGRNSYLATRGRRKNIG